MLIETATGRIHLREYGDIIERDPKPGFYADVLDHLRVHGTLTLDAIAAHFGRARKPMQVTLHYLRRKRRVSQLDHDRWKALT